ncbi:DEAD/DEAH box helicase [Pedobacter sp.]|jgi:DNA repair protein RadD|uniref:DEAD/DEAH box helicase n=1 Tax=Pedobacter sp. TaxID=1411316 RepID=UPI002C5D7AB6|nr:DEAD/DEAH box helicase family protein [Pedobacter sp.]HWW39650.1 DEAD/DEAH box helicase family protein [Pedobacter sp.]
MKILRNYQQQAVNECWKFLKKDNEPVLLMASVGSGKSLMIASILLDIQHAHKRALCLVNNSELVQNNCVTFNIQGGDSSIYCAALDSKDTSGSVIFGTPQSILNGINKNETISQIKFNLIVVDEAHAINFNNINSCFMRILRHYKQEYKDMRILGATGTNYRFKGTAIVGNDCLFRTQVGNITTLDLIKNKYLIAPHFSVDEKLIIDFSKVRIKQNGLFDQKDLAFVINKSTRITELICKQIVHIMESQKKFGIFIFATTRRHAEEILSHLPETQSALILGDTPQEERTRILDAARQGKIKYLVNIAIISVGVDIPAYDTLAYLRPTESLVLLVQTMGRVLRLSPDTNKTEALILDFAGNIERHRDWDDPILQDAVQSTIDKDKPYVILCPQCNVMNTEHARRCIGSVNDKRCDYYFEFKECHNQDCKVNNDITARHCRACEIELIDPNAKLNLDTVKKSYHEVRVLGAKYALSGTNNKFRVSCIYSCIDNNGRKRDIFEHYTPSSEKAKNVFYGQFVRRHCNKSSQWYPYLMKRHKVEEMLQEINTPSRLLITPNENGILIKKKFFD